VRIKAIQHPWYAPLFFILPGYSLMQKSQMLTKIKVIVHSHGSSGLQIAQIMGNSGDGHLVYVQSLVMLLFLLDFKT
jgi:hypothetical protein